ncbi:hypothetical protein [Anabaena sphaerica]|nr:hypothetical protein [Anabaena sphaerica]
MSPDETATADDLQNAYELKKHIAPQRWILLTGEQRRKSNFLP